MMPDLHKTSISWLEVILLLLLTIGGMGTYVALDNATQRCMRTLAPVEESYKIGLIAQERRVSSLAKELDAAEASLVEKRQEQRRTSTMLKAMADVCPELQSVFPAQSSLQLQHETVARYVEARLGVETRRCVLQGLTAEVTQLRSEVDRLTSDISTRQVGSQEYATTEALLGSARKRLDGAQDRLTAERLALVEQQAAGEAITVLCPQLKQIAMSPVLPPLTWRTYLEKRQALTELDSLVAELTTDKQRVHGEFITASTELANAKTSSARRFIRDGDRRRRLAG